MKIIEQGQKLDVAQKALILLHGRGSTAIDILSLAKKFSLDSFYLAAPQAPDNSWYPYSLMEEEKRNEPRLSASITAVKKIIDDTAQVIPKNQIYFMGFSQGASLALEISARYAAKYGGIIAFSGALIGSAIDKKKYHGDFEKTQVFIGTSENDPYIPLIRSKQSKELLEKLGAEVTLKVYEGASHTITEEEIQQVKKLFPKLS
jgi:phospholipase/carboxylesterase